MKRVWLWISRIVILFVPLWSALVLIRTFRRVDVDRLFDLSFTSNEITVFVHGAILLVWALFALEATRSMSKWGNWTRAFINLRFRPHHVVMGALSLTTANTSVVSVDTTAAVPASTVVSPAIAATVLADVLCKRREQVRARLRPMKLSEEHQLVARRLVTLSAASDSESSQADVVTQSEVVELMMAVETTELNEEVVPDVVNEWRLLVRVYGYPPVESAQGNIAQFRKRRSLELVSWLALNRDRQRRSAARNALWDIDVSDSTFATVVSDLRRALFETDHSLTRDQIIPTTYSDEMPLHVSVTTDFEVIQDALYQFRIDNQRASELREALLLIRDVPFAGTSYSWADYDGTTTRLIVTALDAATELANWAKLNNQIEIANDAVVAGLRVMPGCDELIELHKSLLPVAQTSRHRVSH